MTTTTKQLKQQSISNYTKPTAGQLRESQKKQQEKKEEMSTKEDNQLDTQQQWEKEYQQRGRILDSDDEDQVHSLVQNTTFTSQANQKEEGLDLAADKELENSLVSEPRPALTVPTSTTITEQLAKIDSLLKKHASRDLPLKIQTEDDIAASELSSMSSELKPNSTITKPGIMNVSTQERQRGQQTNSLQVGIPEGSTLVDLSIPEESVQAKTAKGNTLKETKEAGNLAEEEVKQADTTGTKKSSRTEEVEAEYSSIPPLKKTRQQSPKALDTAEEKSDLEAKKQAVGQQGKETSPSKKKFKKVNCNSLNRRECRRIYEDDSDDTQDRSNQTRHSNHYATRVMYKVTLKASEDSTEAFAQNVQRLLSELQQSDDSIVILPWKKADSTLLPISKMEQVPESITKLCKYFDRVFLPKNRESAVIYTSFMMGHNSCFSDIREDLQSWLSNNDQGLYNKMLQAEDGRVIGWLLYSTREMDAGALADEIKDITGIAIGLRWMTVNTGTKKIAERSQLKCPTKRNGSVKGPCSIFTPEK